MKAKGPGDYLVAGPTYQIIDKAIGPEIDYVFNRVLHLGSMRRSPSFQFAITPEGEQSLWGAVQDKPTRILFGHADDPESLEAMTAKAAVLDEAGQNKFKLGSWEAVQRRLSIHQGRALLPTTPYNVGWLKQQVYDRWKAGDKNYDVIRFESIENPAFPIEEYERAKQTLPLWKFRMFYKGEFARPAGMIYDCFDPDVHKSPWFKVDESWPRYVGIDFGGVNTAATFWAEEPRTGKLWCYDEYHAGGMTAAEHGAEIIKRAGGIPAACVGGSKSEGQWRQEFGAGGLPVWEPDQPDVEVGINRVYGLLAERACGILDRNPRGEGGCPRLLDEIASYSREVDDMGNPTEKIEDKEMFHLADATRYIIGWLRKPYGDAVAPSTGAMRFDPAGDDGAVSDKPWWYKGGR